MISDENHARALLDAASDNAAVDDDAVYEAPAIGESVDDAAVPAESPAAAPHPQDNINVVAEIPEAPVIETASAALAIEAGTSAAAATRGGQEPPQVASSPSSGESLTAAAAKPRRPANDPFAALYGLSEEELIADRVVQLKRFGNLEQKFHDRVVVISRRALRHILLVKDSCSARDSVNGTEVAFH